MLVNVIDDKTQTKVDWIKSMSFTLNLWFLCRFHECDYVVIIKLTKIPINHYMISHMPLILLPQSLKSNPNSKDETIFPNDNNNNIFWSIANEQKIEINKRFNLLENMKQLKAILSSKYYSIPFGRFILLKCRLFSVTHIEAHTFYDSKCSLKPKT